MSNQQQTSTTPLDERDHWRTPRWLFDWADRRFDFQIDLAASDQNKMLPHFIDETTNSLTVDWLEFAKSKQLLLVGWLNPPYSDIDPWMARAVEEAHKGFTTVMLLPAPNGEDRYGRYVFGVATELIMITGRIAFEDTNGRPVSGNTRGSCFVVYRGHDLGHTRHCHVWRDEMKKSATNSGQLWE